MDKPPLGVQSRGIWIENRILELLAAITRWVGAGKGVGPNVTNWCEELAERQRDLQKAPPVNPTPAEISRRFIGDQQCEDSRPAVNLDNLGDHISLLGCTCGETSVPDPNRKKCWTGCLRCDLLCRIEEERER